MRPPAQIAVIVPAFTAARFLSETLESVRDQSFKHWECVVVDDGSTDDTAAIAQKYVDADPRFHLIRQANTGPAGARDTGLAAVSPDVGWLAFLDSDDTWLPGALDLLVAATMARPDAVGVYGLAELMDEGGTPVRPGVHPAGQRDRRRPGRLDLVAVPIDADGTFDSLAVSGTIWPPAVGLFRRDVVEAVGGFDRSQRLAEDWDLFLRMSRRGPFVPVDRQVAWYRQHDDNLTKDSVAMAYFHARVLWKAWYAVDGTRAQRKVLRHVWLRSQLRWVLWCAQATVHARSGGQARAAAAATVLFLGQLARGRPCAPTERSARYLARFVADRRAGHRADPWFSMFCVE